MNKKAACKRLISTVYKMLCWREEDKRWQTIWEELLREIPFSQYLTDEEKGVLLLKLTPIQYFEFSKFKQVVFEIINYAEFISSL